MSSDPMSGDHEVFVSTQSKATRLRELISTLPKANRGFESRQVFQYQGFWYHSNILQGILSAQEQFQAQPTDVLIAGSMKTGNTWLKALCFAIATRNQFSDIQTPLLTNLPHELFPFLEDDFSNLNNPVIKNLRQQHSFLSTHMPYNVLPQSIILEGCKIIYICREPKDTFVSLFHFTKQFEITSDMGLEVVEQYHLSLSDEFEYFCQGKNPWGPYWEHALGYYRASLERPDKILFLKYEELKADTAFYVKKLAEFMDKPFSVEEQKLGLPEKIVEMCSFENLSSLEVNQTGKHLPVGPFVIHNSAYFRKGKTGDWKNCLSNDMAEKIDSITREKLKESGFSFGISTGIEGHENV